VQSNEIKMWKVKLFFIESTNICLVYIGSKIEQGLIVTKRGLVEKHTCYFPQILVDRFDGQTLFLKITDKDAGINEGR
jgi:hypothetical protein